MALVLKTFKIHEKKLQKRFAHILSYVVIFGRERLSKEISLAAVNFVFL